MPSAAPTAPGVALGILAIPGNTSPNGVSTACMGNLVWSGALNAALISGTDTTSLVAGFGGGIGSGATGAFTSLLKGRLVAGNAQAAGPAFAGSPFDQLGVEHFRVLTDSFL